MEPQTIAPQNLAYELLTLWLKKPAGFFFLACICFYFLSQVLRVNPYVGIAGALAYAYATYNAVIIYVGHDTKMQAIALVPALIGSLLLIFERRYWWGVALTALSMAMLVMVNHPQIAYYALIIVAFMTAGYIIRWIRRKEFRHLVLSLGLAITSCVIGVLCNAVITLITLDYTPASIRGGSELAKAGGSVTRTGLSQEYAFSYSMYKTEPMELMFPKIYGGSVTLEVPEDKSKAIAALQEMPPQLGQQLQGFLLFYWGGIGSTTGGPAYAGAIVCFLALLGFVVLDGKHKWWILAAGVVGLLMSWGGYFAGFNGLLLKLLPGYDKFRAPSVILVIPNFLLCVMAVLSLDRLLTIPAADRAIFWEKYKKGLYLAGGFFVFALLLYFSFDYTSDRDRSLSQQVAAQGGQVAEYVHNFLRGLREDRQDLFMGSITRSFLFIAVAAALVALSIKGRIRPLLAVGAIGALSFIDLIVVDAHYLNSDLYQEEEEAQTPYTPTAADQAILQDKSYFRVFDIRQGVGNALTYGAPTSYFHRSIGGYHPAKLSIYEDLIEHQLGRFPDCQGVINMLNTKYIIQPDGRGQDSLVLNPGALGAAWFVRDVKYVSTPQAMMDALTGLDTRDTAVVFTSGRGNANLTIDEESAGVAGNPVLGGDSIRLMKNDHDEMVYESVATRKRFAVFSEIFYDRGWKAYVDESETPIVRTNYVLRGVSVPAGKHTIRMVFHPNSFYTGKMLQGIAGVVLLLLLAGAIVVEVRKRKVGNI